MKAIPRFIVVTGTPGTGKTLLASRLALFLRCSFTTISWLVFERALWTGYDRERRSFIIDFDGLVTALRGLVSGSRCFILDTHWLEPVAELGVKPDLVLLLRANPLVLVERLARRHWPWRKVVENVEAELVGVIALEASRLFPGLVFEIDTSRLDPRETLRAALRALKEGARRCCIDWLSVLSGEEMSKLIARLEAGGSWRGGPGFQG